MKKLSLAILILLILALPQREVPAQVTAESTRPNILFILADDLGSESSELYPALYNPGVASGHGLVATPTLSSLASRGIVFDNVWAAPLCSPTRGAILSGLYGHNSTVTNVGDVLPESTTSIFELLAAASAPSPRYNMAVYGKWHLSGASGVNHVVQGTGVPEFKGFLGSHVRNYYSWMLDSSSAPSANTTVYTTTALTDFAIDFIRKQNRNQPWFVYLPYGAPHGTAPFNGFQVPPSNLFKTSVGRPAGDPAVFNNDIPVYQAVVQALDTEIGRLFRAMDQAGQLNNTVIIFMGDNGTPNTVKDAASRIRSSKGSVYEGGVRVPLIVAGPGVTRSGRDSNLISSPDIYATVAQLAGISLTNNSINNSHSIVPLLKSGQATTGRKYSFTELCANTGAGTKLFAIRDQRYKLLYNGTTWEMFDLESDPWEATNIYRSAQHAAPRAALLAELRALRMKAATNGCFVDIPD
jgi:arylsulfatase A-like enzyme